MIITEWKVPKLTGPLLVQRVRQHGFVTVPIVVASSLVTRDDLLILQEMGVDDVLEKPIERDQFFRKVISVLQNTRFPTEQKSLEIKIRRLLAKDSVEKARRLVAQFYDDARIDTSSRQCILAELEYAQGSYRKACLLAVSSLKGIEESIPQLDILGKCFLKLKKFQAALKCLEIAQKVSPQNVERLLSIAKVQLELNDAAGAERALGRADALDPTNHLVCEMRCNIALAKGDNAAAAELFTQLESLKIGP